jgi:hypothetical protein
MLDCIQNSCLRNNTKESRTTSTVFVAVAFDVGMIAATNSNFVVKIQKDFTVGSDGQA